MIENTKCACGHNNPVGTILCEYCGKPLDEAIKNSEQTIENEMRYEGKARRSQTYTTSLFDKTWAFFSSVKVAIVLIVITLIASGIGTIFPQETFVPSSNPEGYYEDEYGLLGKWFYLIGFSDMYNSWWYILLLSMIGVSLVVCSLDRVIPLYKALNNQKVIKNTEFIKRQRISHVEKIVETEKEHKRTALIESLQQKRYNVSVEDDAILAEKGRISRWGPYINHIGLILFLFGVFLRFVPGWYLSETMWLQEEEVKKIPELPYYVKNERSLVEMYEPHELPPGSENQTNFVKEYQTDVTLYQKDDTTGKLTELKKGQILINHPFEYEDLLLYQSDLKAGQLSGLELAVIDKENEQEVGSFSVDLYDIKANQVYHANGLNVKVKSYFPDFELQGNQPITKSQKPNRPAFVIEVTDPKTKRQEVSWVISGMDFENPQDNQYNIQLKDFKLVNTAGLIVRVDRSLSVMLVGGIVSMIGLVMGFYWQHRRVWVRVTNNQIVIGGHTNKNWYSLRRDIQSVAETAGLKIKLVKE
ncbi:cytochrome c biogenesis protein ResB [Hazenella sp. IB182357]|uniref:Cytochrome c biogenesis protein ResB n=1 Tax=Polycladospora coralii TaxID=2771432 RepID=A0A926N9X3_9BACL|nr:cytochrome c biogenesis protein ResB [Polycladospora coralii]MBD1371665.1 cytochrome c biogenesis protein ResB [Polycladospora coralii]MBS7529132.1 cytochrome c biogenesis protein ResB [Polycladospora coralii]